MFSKFFKHQPVAANTEEKVHVNVQLQNTGEEAKPGDTLLCLHKDS